MKTGASTAQPQFLSESVERGVLETFSQFLERIGVTGQDNMKGICDGPLGVISFIGDHPFSSTRCLKRLSFHHCIRVGSGHD